MASEVDIVKMKIKEKEEEILEMRISVTKSNDATDKSLLLQYNSQLTELLKQQSFLMGDLLIYPSQNGRRSCSPKEVLKPSFQKTLSA